MKSIAAMKSSTILLNLQLKPADLRPKWTNNLLNLQNKVDNYDVHFQDLIQVSADVSGLEAEPKTPMSFFSS